MAKLKPQPFQIANDKPRASAYWTARPSSNRTSPPEPPTPDAERRQLTVMFCDLADSTRLSGQLDPEDLRDVIRAYQSTSAEVIERYDGYIAQHLGDGLMVYFGWPQAHEDDAQRAARAGLGILEAMPLFADLLSLPIPENRYPPLNLSPQRQRQKTLETIVAMLLQQVEERPVLFILDPARVCDQSSTQEKHAVEPCQLISWS